MSGLSFWNPIGSHLLLQADHTRPLLFEQAFILFSRGVVEAVANVELVAEGLGRVCQAGGAEVGNEGLVAISTSANRYCVLRERRTVLQLVAASGDWSWRTWWLRITIRVAADSNRQAGGARVGSYGKLQSRR